MNSKCNATLLALALVLAFLTRLAKSEVNLSQLDGFRVSARVRIARSVDYQYKPDYNATKDQAENGRYKEYLIDEYYSNTEKRARLDMRLIYFDGTMGRNIIQYYHDGARQTTLRQTSGPELDCKLAGPHHLADDLFGGMSNIDGHMTDAEWFKEREDVPNYIIGFARLLFIAEANKDKMTRQREAEMVRNQEVAKYAMLDFIGSVDRDDQHRLFLYYSASKDQANKIPLRIEWKQAKTVAQIFVDYSRFSVISNDMVAETSTDSIHHSLLMYPLDSGCSGLVGPSKLLADSKLEPKIVSFRMHVDSYVDAVPRVRNYFVAYDDHAKALRLDEIDERSDGESQTTIHDFWLSRRYNIRHSKPPGEGPTNDTIRVDTAATQCAASRISASQSGPINFQPLIPFWSLAKMGSATIRGARAVVFEQSGVAVIPSIFTPPNGNRDYTVIYYFATASSLDASQGPLQVDGQQLGPLVRVQAFRKGIAAFVVDIEHFMWQLADAPNGDRASELFALEDACYGDRLRPESLATLNMDVDMALAKQPTENADQEMLFNKLNCSARRNVALSRALYSGWLSATQLYDVESRVYKQQQATSKPLSVGIKVNAKINHQNQMLYEAAAVGNGVWRVRAESTNANSYDDCFWDAMHRRRHDNEVLFAYCDNSCKIDSHVSVKQGQDDNVQVTFSTGFNIGHSYSSACTIYHLRPVEDHTEFVSQTILKEIQVVLRKQRLKLLMPSDNYGQNMIDNEIIGSAKMVQIGNNRWSEYTAINAAAALGSESQINGDTLAGVGLVIEGGAERVMPKPLGGGKPKIDNDMDEDLSSSSMNYAFCHSTCLANINCRSFSLCSTSGQLECLISEQGFREPTILAQIHQQKTNLRASSSRAAGLISLQRDANATIELRVDRRCHLYNKQALEMFKPPIDRDILIDPVISAGRYVVESEQQCAEICMQINVNFFRRLDKSKADALDGGEFSDTGTLLSRVHAWANGDIGHWCDSFSYTDKNERELPEKLLEIVDPSINKTGICFMRRAPSSSKLVPSGNKNNDKTTESTMSSVHVRRYEFTYSTLYEPRPGLKLHPVTPMGRLDALSFDEMRNFIHDGNNQGFVVGKDVETCARICFLESAIVEPWCQSFAFFIDSPKSYCIFNSNTLDGAQRSHKSELLVSNVTASKLYCHYEPRNSLNLDAVLLFRSIREASINNEDSKRASKNQPKYSRIISVIIIFLAINSGFALAKFVDPYLMANITTAAATTQPEANGGHTTPSTNGFLTTISNSVNRRYEQDIDLSHLIKVDDSEMITGD